MESPVSSFRISGHETFSLRFAWLPKAVKGVTGNPRLFQSEDDAMVVLGVGKNMVRAIRFWAECAGVLAQNGKNGHLVTPLGLALLGPQGFDRFLEDAQTLWVLHWQLASHPVPPLLAWHYLLNVWHREDLTLPAVMTAIRRDPAVGLDDVSDSTLESHFQVFLHTYAGTRGLRQAGGEDSLDSPLVNLQLLTRVDSEAAKDSRYVFGRGSKPEIGSGLFAWFLNDFMRRRESGCMALSFREVATGHGAPGAVLQLAEADIRERLFRIESETQGRFASEETLNVHVVRRERPFDPVESLKWIYAC